MIDFDIADETQKVETGHIHTNWTQDQLRILRLTQNANLYTGGGGSLSGSVTVSFGLDPFGPAALPMSRGGAKPNFTKLEISSRYTQSVVSKRVQWSVAGKAQTSFGHVLASSEQMGLGGFDWLSAFEGGALEGDSGIALRSELAFPVVLPAMAVYPALGTTVSPYLFGAAGLAKLEKPSAVEDSITHAASFGTGLRFGLSETASPHGATLSLEYAHGVQSHGSSENRFNLRFLMRF